MTISDAIYLAAGVASMLTAFLRAAGYALAR
jgi:hypothetical protein